ncbi:hypothetical protein AB1Y20_002132 [Prymnesium parvum]|uniref:Uncharacterized protein n=1 Tax=Prymnesium parvum TaxID=97485 RepID=A0AB34J9R6_PRYPA
MAGRSREGYCQPRVEGSMQGARVELEDQLKEARLDGLREPRAEGLREARHRRIEQSPLAMSVHFKFPLAPIAHAAPAHPSAKQSLLQRVLDGPARSSLVSAGVDAVQLAYTAALHQHFVCLSEAAASRMPQPPSQCERRRIHQEASALCRQFNQIAMSCLEVNSPPRTVKLARAVAHECLQRALRLVPARADKLLAATLCNTGLLYLQRRKPTHATRFLRRAIALDADPVTNARSKLNLSSALAQLKELDEALRHAQSAFDLLQEAAAGQTEREGEDEDGTGAGGSVETDSAVLSVLALRSITICHEALGNHSQAHRLALSNVRTALKMGEAVLPGECLPPHTTATLLRELAHVSVAGGSPLMSQLSQYEHELANRKSRRSHRTADSKPLDAFTSRCHRAHCSKPLDAATSRCDCALFSKPLDASASRGQRAAGSRPLGACASRGQRAGGSRSLDAATRRIQRVDGAIARDAATAGSDRSFVKVALPRLDEHPRPVRLKSRESDKAEPSDALPKAVMSKAEMEALYVRLQQTGRVSHSEDRSRGERSPVSPARLKPAHTTSRSDAERSGKSRARDRPIRPDPHTHEDARTSDDVDDLGLISSDLKPEQMIRLIRIQRKIRARVARKYAIEEKKIARNAGDALSRLASWVRSRHILLPGMAATGGRSCKAKGEDSETGSGVDSEASELTGPEPSMLNAVRSFTRIHEKDSAVSPAKKLIASLEKRVRRPLPLCMQRGYFAMGGRTLRIFLSSTFRDMNGEREILLKKYAPALRQMGRERGVFISFVDLRWGVTKEQAQGGEVVDICLSELGRSHYFVNFLGLRGGWRPTKAQVTKPTFNKFPFLTSYCPGRSVTEFEVLYGALGWGPKSVVHPRSAFFYMRDDAYVEKLPKEERVHFKEQDKEGIKRLADLKHRIRKRAAESEKHNGRALNRSTLPYVECLREYENPSDFAELVYQDLQKAIERDYPPRPMMSHLDAIMWRHVAYAKAQVHAYIVSETVVSAISSYVDGVQQSADGIRRPLIIDGVRGSGKTAALAHWFLNNTRSGFVLPHFVGCNADSTDHVLCLRRMLLELQRSFNLDSEEFNKRGLPNDQEAIASLLPVWLARAAMEGPIVIIIDGLDQLRDADGVSLGWLPATLPSNCSLILSANRIGAIDSALTRRGWGSPSCTVPPLSEKEREALATKYLRLVNKTLEPHQLIMLSRHKNCSTPLFIRMTCDEMIASAVFETIEEVIAYCTSKPDCLALSEVMLERFEHQFERVMVERAFCYLLVSRNGLEAQELIKLLGCSQTAWSTFYFAAGEALHEDSGQLTIGAHVLRAAVAKRYLRAASKKALVHMDLVSFFQQADDVIEQRRMQELPFHMLQTGQVEPLRALLLDLTRIRHLLPHRDGRHDLEVYWDAVGGGKPPPGLGETYLRVLEEQREQLKTDIAQENTAHDMSKRVEVRATDAREASIANLAGLVGVFLAELKQYDGAELLQRIAFDIERSVRDSISMEVAARARDLARTLCLQDRPRLPTKKTSRTLSRTLGSQSSLSNLREGVPSPKNKKRSKVLEASSSNGEHGSSALSRENSKVLGFNAQEEGAQTLPIVTESTNGSDVLSGQNNDGLEFKARAEGSLRMPIMEESMNGALSREDSEGLEFKGQGVGPRKPLAVAESSKRVSKTLSFSDDWKSKATDDLRQQVGEAEEADAESSLQRMESRDAKHTEGSDEEGSERPSHLLKRLMHSRKQLSHLDVVSEDEKAVIEDIAATSAKEMLAQALKFRKEMQGEMHVQVGYCLVKIADAHWADWEFAEVLSTYKTAIPIFASVFGTEACAPVVQIYSGCALACTAVGDFEQALMWNQKALDIVDTVCSPTSWERYRVLVDHARMLEFSVKQARTYFSADARNVQSTTPQSSCRDDALCVCWCRSFSYPRRTMLA